MGGEDGFPSLCSRDTECNEGGKECCGGYDEGDERVDGQFFLLGCITIRGMDGNEYIVGYLDSTPIFCLQDLMVCDDGWIDM